MALNDLLSPTIIANEAQNTPSLTALASTTSAADTAPYFTGVGTATTTSLTSAGRALIDDADSSAQRTTLGLGTLSTQSANAVSLTGGSVGGLTGLGVGTVVPTAGIVVQGTAATDGPTLSAELLSSSGWTSTDWTGSWTGWVHTAGNTSVLSNTLGAVIGSRYQISATVSGTAGTFVIGFGGVNSTTLTFTAQTNTYGMVATSTAALTITPSTDFSGTIALSVKTVTSASTPILQLKSSDGVVRNEKRVTPVLYNLMIGYGSGSYLINGTQNVSLGYNSSLTNMSGSNNTAIGVNALKLNLAVNNTAVGCNSLQNTSNGVTNSAVGLNSLMSNVNGNYNCALGGNTLYFNLNGSHNIGIGFNAGTNSADASNNTTMQQNIFIGTSTKSKLVNPTNEIVIGYNATGAGSNTCTLGVSSIPITNLLTSAVAPTITNFGTNSAVTYNNGTTAFIINVGTGNGSTGTINLPTAAHGWVCQVTNMSNQNTNNTYQSGGTVSTVVLSNYSRISRNVLNWSDNDILLCTCFAY